MSGYIMSWVAGEQPALPKALLCSQSQCTLHAAHYLVDDAGDGVFRHSACLLPGDRGSTKLLDQCWYRLVSTYCVDLVWTP